MRFLKISQNQMSGGVVNFWPSKTDQGTSFGRVIAMIATNVGLAPDIEDAPVPDAIGIASTVVNRANQSVVHVVDQDDLWQTAWGTLGYLAVSQNLAALDQDIGVGFCLHPADRGAASEYPILRITHDRFPGVGRGEGPVELPGGSQNDLKASLTFADYSHSDLITRTSRRQATQAMVPQKATAYRVATSSMRTRHAVRNGSAMTPRSVLFFGQGSTLSPQPQVCRNLDA